MRAFREHPHFADLFAHLHFLCWPILWWQLNALYRRCKREGIAEMPYSVSDWGFITVHYRSVRPDARA